MPISIPMRNEETEPLVGSRAAPPPYPQRNVVALVGACVALAGVVGLASHRRTAGDNKADLDEISGLSFNIENTYGNAVPGDGLYPWDLIAEPHKISTFSAVDPGGLQLFEGSPATFHWHIPAENKLVWGTSMEHKFITTGLHVVNIGRFEVNPLTGKNSQTHHATKTVMVKYVKREMRALSEEDRESFLGALQTVYSTTTEEGVKLYGSSFVGIEQLVREHLDGAGTKDCDHWHDGAGIMTHHLGFTLKLELALQSVDASVTIPYWEYTLDDSKYGSGWRKSPIFEQDWFGNAGVNLGEGHYIKNGRWENLGIMTDATGYSQVTNMYGMLRAPWNLNAEPFVTRGDTVAGQTYMDGTLPGCAAIKSCFDSTTLADMNTCLNGETHGPIHILLGGQWDVDLGVFFGQKFIGAAQLLLFKNLWRQGFATCPSADQVEEGEEEAACSCSSDVVTAVGGAYEVLKQSKSLERIASGAATGTILWDSTTERWTLPGLSDEEEEAAWKDLLVKLCSPGKVGEMYSSAAPYDPIFWVVHTTSERLMQYRRLRSVSSTKEPEAFSFDQTWGYTHDGADSDTGMVCDWDNLDESTGLPTCTLGTCEGHHADDVLPFDLSAASGALHKGTTNQEFYDWLDPTNEDIPYVYDTFKYEHCASMGVDIGAAVDDDYITGTPPKSG